MGKVYKFLFEGKLDLTNSRWVFPFALRVQWNREENLIDVKFSRKDAIAKGLIRASGTIGSKEERELIPYALYRMIESTDLGEIEAVNELLVDYEQFQIKNILEELPFTGEEIDEFLNNKKPLTYTKENKKGEIMGEQLEEVKILNISEAELESYVKSSLDDIETGLTLIDTQVNTYRGPLDILAADNEGCLVVIELKVREDDDMLFQAMDYYDWVQENIDTVNRMYKNIHPTVEVNYKIAPRLMLIAPSFPSSLKRRAKYLSIDIDLYIYRFIEIGGKRGLLFEQVDIAPLRVVPPSPPTISDLMNRPQNDEHKTLIKELGKAIKEFASDMEPYPTTEYIGYKVRGSWVVSVHPRKTACPRVAISSEGGYKPFPLENKDDIKKIIDLINKAYTSKKGLADTENEKKW